MSRSATRRRRESGNALAITLIASALLVPLGALAVVQARTSFLIQQNLRSEAEAFRIAESGLAVAAASLSPAVDRASLLAGPDGVGGTADDGTLPAGAAISALDLQPPLRLELHIASDGEFLRITSVGYAGRGAQRQLEQLVRSAADPFSPSALYSEAGAVPAFGTGSFALSGLDHRPTDAIATATGTGSNLPAFAVLDPQEEIGVRSSLSADAASRLIGPGGSPSMGHSGTALFDAAMQRAMSSASGVVIRPLDEPLPSAFGSSTAPQLSIVDSDATFDDIRTGAGILVVRGRMRLTGSFRFDGLVLASGGVVVESSSSAAIYGSVWTAQPLLDFWGEGGIVRCASCLKAADADFPGILPHAFEVLGWREVDQD